MLIGRRHGGCHGPLRARRWCLALLAVHAPAFGDEAITNDRARADGAHAPARDARDSASRASAKVHFDRGLALAQGGNWEAALGEFLASRAMFPTRSATRNAAVALRNLGRYTDAVSLYQTLLEEFAASMPEAEAAAIRADVVDVLRNVAELEIRGADPGVSVEVDGVLRGATPLGQPLRLNAGPHSIRLSKPGFEPRTDKLYLPGNRATPLDGRLERVPGVTTLIVLENDGEDFDVVVDGAVVGRTPWQGPVSQGLHSVWLRGSGVRGAQPVTVQLTGNEAATVSLPIVALDSSLSVKARPPHASVYLDGAFAGIGGWNGNVTSGRHRLEFLAAGHLPLKRDVELRPGASGVVQAELDRDDTAKVRPSWTEALYFEAGIGALWAPTLNGGADDACGCRDRRGPYGWSANAHAGLTLLRGLGIEAAAGYFDISEKLVRTQSALGDANQRFEARNYTDSVALSGPFAALGASFRLFERTPFMARLSGGVMWLGSESSNRGSFAGTLRDPSGTGETASFSARLSMQEASYELVTPFLSSEVRLGYRLTTHLSIDVGAAVLLVAPPRVQRVGTSVTGGGTDRALQATPSGAWSNGQPQDPGLLELPRESLAGPFVAFSPSLAVRFSP